MPELDVLIASPDQLTRSFGKSPLLAARGCRTELSQTAEDAIVLFKHRTFSLALIEFDLVGMNGIELLKLIRCGQTEAPNTLPIGILASFADTEFLTACLDLDLQSLLLKPVSVRDVARRISRILSVTMAFKPTAVYRTIKTPLSSHQLQEKQAENGRSQVAVLRPIVPRPPNGPSTDDQRQFGLNNQERLFGPHKRRAVSELDLGWQISMDILGSNGVRLIAAGTVLTPRLLARLEELAEIGQVGFVWARAPLKQKESRVSVTG